jgi:uncharacterized protein YjbI with pentapeptide repeats
VWVWVVGVPSLYADVPGVAPADRLSAITTTRTALLAGLVGLGAIGTLLVNSRTYWITAATFKITERGHLTDRYAKAIEQLGDDKLDVRLGGIYALEQLAADSEVARDQATIVEVLSAFVRVHSQPRYQLKEQGSELPVSDMTEECMAEFKRPPDDVQAAVTVLARLPERPELPRADFNGAFLRRAIMVKGQMAFTEVPLGVVTWHSITASDAATGNLARATFANTDLRGALFASANLTEARFLDADLAGAQLTKANLTRAVFIRVDLTGANLNGADLTNAEMGGALLEGAQLHGANLALAKGVSQKRLDSALGDSTTRLPADLRRPKDWPQVDGG